MQVIMKYPLGSHEWVASDGSGVKGGLLEINSILLIQE